MLVQGKKLQTCFTLEYFRKQFPYLLTDLFSISIVRYKTEKISKPSAHFEFVRVKSTPETDRNIFFFRK